VPTGKEIVKEQLVLPVVANKYPGREHGIAEYYVMNLSVARTFE
jgi:hypothetical protein